MTVENCIYKTSIWFQNCTSEISAGNRASRETVKWKMILMETFKVTHFPQGKATEWNEHMFLEITILVLLGGRPHENDWVDSL